MAIFSCKNETKEVDEADVVTTTDDAVLTIDEENETEHQKTLLVQMEPKSGSNLSGTVEFTEEGGGVTMKARINGLATGTHAMHIHETGDCSAADASSAGGHWNPTFEQHGEWGDDEGFHRGDIGNFETNADGVAEFTFSTDQWCIGCDDQKKNIVGKSIIVHDGVDDYESQPSGNSGTRVGCGVIRMEQNQTATK